MELYKSLSRYETQYPGEKNTVTVFRDFLLSTSKPFDRATQEGHITGSAVVVDVEVKHILLTHHKKLNRWLQLGGHMDAEENTLQAAHREALEESGIDPVGLRHISEEIFDIDIFGVPQHGDEPAHFHYDVRHLFRADAHLPLVNSDESHEVAWKRMSTLLEDESLGVDMRRLLLKIVEYDKWKLE